MKVICIDASPTSSDMPCPLTQLDYYIVEGQDKTGRCYRLTGLELCWRKERFLPVMEETNTESSHNNNYKNAFIYEGNVY